MYVFGKYMFLIFAALLITSNVANARKLIFLATEVSFNPKYQHDNRAFIDNGTLYMVISVVNDYTHDQWVELAISARNGKTDSYRMMLRYDFNFCRIFRKKESKLLAATLNIFLSSGNLPLKCPILKGNYSWKMTTDAFDVPQFFPPSQYKLIMNTYFRTKPVPDSTANTTFYWEVK